MSDRLKLFEIPAARVGWGEEGESVTLYMDGESGTWRLYLSPSAACVDFSLAALREFHEQLGAALRDVESDPETFNAEVRSKWETEETL